MSAASVVAVDSGQPLNPYTQIILLQDHTDIVRLLLKIDDFRCSSAGDDCTVIIWDVKNGWKLHHLKAHNRPIGCMHVMYRQKKSILLTGASDKQICMWDVETGSCLVSLTQLASTTRCLAVLDGLALFCSGGEKLCLWNEDGDMLHVLTREENEDIHQMAAVSKHRIITVVDKQLVVYDVGRSGQDLCLVQKLPPHREAISTLAHISDTCFVSGSLDGSIVVWMTETLVAAWTFNSVEDYLGRRRHYPYSVRHITSINERFIACAVGSGFSVYDVKCGELVAEKVDAHYSKIVHLQFVHDRRLLASCSEDGAMRLWGAPTAYHHCLLTGGSTDGRAQHTQTSQLFSEYRGLKQEGGRFHLELLGECFAHTGTVQMCVDVGDSGVVTCGTDALVILWRDGAEENRNRNKRLYNYLHHNS